MKVLFLFIILAPIVTLSHEFAHYLTAKYYNQEAKIHYNRTTYKESLTELNDKDSLQIISPIQVKSFRKQKALITLMGPLSTLLIGLIGLFCLMIYIKGNKTYTLLFFYFLSLFVLRFIYNYLFFYIIKNSNSYFNNDEYKLASYLNFSPKTTHFFLLLVSIVIVGFSTKLILKKITIKTLILNIGVAILLGFFIWFGFLGKLLMP
jgi:hypothetical protein